MYIGLHAKCPVYFCQILEKLKFLIDFVKILISNFMKICPVGAVLFSADG